MVPLPTLIVNSPSPIVGAEGKTIETLSSTVLLTCPYLSTVIRGMVNSNVLPNSPSNDFFTLLAVVMEETSAAIEGPLSA
jgi:hypothetical protein